MTPTIRIPATGFVSLGEHACVISGDRKGLAYWRQRRIRTHRAQTLIEKARAGQTDFSTRELDLMESYMKELRG